MVVYTAGVTPSIPSNTVDAYGEPRPSAGRTAIGALNDGRPQSFTVGTGGDFTKWEDAFDTYSIGIGGDRTYTQISHTVDDYVATFNDELNGYKLLVTSDNPPDGDPNGGWISEFTYDNVGLSIIPTAGFSSPEQKYGGEFELCNLNIRRTVVDYGALCRASVSNGTLGSVHDLVTDYRYANAAIVQLSGDQFYRGTGVVSGIYIYNILQVGYRTNSSRYAMDVRNGGYGGGFYMENVTVVLDSTMSAGTGFTFYPSGTYSYQSFVRNCICIGGSPTRHYGTSASNIDSWVGEGNVSGDASGTDSEWALGRGNIVSVTPSNEWYSIDPDDGELFMLPKHASQVRGGGYPSQVVTNTAGIRGNPRPHAQDGEYSYSIGAHESPSDPIFTTPITTQTVDEGDPATYDAAVVGPQSYEWKKNGTTVAKVGPSVGPVQGS
jgi:hypothetical protein